MIHNTSAAVIQTTLFRSERLRIPSFQSPEQYFFFQFTTGYWPAVTTCLQRKPIKWEKKREGDGTTLPLSWFIESSFSIQVEDCPRRTSEWPPNWVAVVTRIFKESRRCHVVLIFFYFHRVHRKWTLASIWRSLHSHTSLILVSYRSTLEYTSNV